MPFGYKTNQQQIDILREEIKELKKEYFGLYQNTSQLEKVLEFSGVLEKIDGDGIIAFTSTDPWYAEYKKHYKVNKVSE